jgi:hypothetical protein
VVREYRAAVGQKRSAAFSDPIPMVMEATIECKMSDGTVQRYILTGQMRADIETDVSIHGRDIGFVFKNVGEAREVKFDA